MTQQKPRFTKEIQENANQKDLPVIQDLLDKYDISLPRYAKDYGINKPDCLIEDITVAKSDQNKEAIKYYNQLKHEAISKITSKNSISNIKDVLDEIINIRWKIATINNLLIYSYLSRKKIFEIDSMYLVSIYKSVERFNPEMNVSPSTYFWKSIHFEFIKQCKKESKDKDQNIQFENDFDIIFEEDYIEKVDLTDLLNHMMEKFNKLNNREKSILNGRFFKNLTLKELGISEGVSRERVRQIEKEALTKLQRACS